MRRKRQAGQAIIMAVLFAGLFLFGAMGLAIDSGQLYAHRQMAQSAADAAAQAAILSVFSRTNTNPPNTNPWGTGATPAPFTCTNGTDARTPCGYARLNDFGTTGSSDTVDVSFPTSVPGVALSANFTPAAVHVLITRNVNMTFARLVYLSATKPIKAAATAAIITTTSPVPIAIMHPTLAGALDVSSSPGAGKDSIKICGGPQLSIEVNSTSPTAVTLNANARVNLSQGGPTDLLGNCGGTGSDFGNFGGPSSPGVVPSWLSVGSTGHYLQPHPPVQDPFASVPAPSEPPLAASPTRVPVGTGACPVSAPKDCWVYTPGTYPTAAGEDLIFKNEVAILQPGVYYVKTADAQNVAFGTDANGYVQNCGVGNTFTCTSAGSDFSQNGVMVYLNQGVLDLNANSDTTLTGSDSTGTYKGLLFFGSRTLVRHSETGNGVNRAHALGGNSAISLIGSIYLINSDADMRAGTYQLLTLGGTGSSDTGVRGEIVVGALGISGSGQVTMTLDAALLLTQDQIALVN